MHNTGEILQLCRLCLVKEQVNVPIFEGQGDVKQIFQKISSCLPVKINRSDKLPKNICDGCSEKLDLFYDFWNTSVNSEKQLLEWLGQTPLSAGAGTTIAAKNSKSTDPVQQIKVDVKQEPSDHTDNNESFQADASAVADEDETSFKSESGPPPKRARRAATKRKPITVAPDTDDDDDDDYEPVEPLTKLEDESGNSDNDNEDDSFANAPSTSADDQPGPSGIGKDGVEAPKRSKYQKKCPVCGKMLYSFPGFDYHMLSHKNDKKYKCELCDYKSVHNGHLRRHMLETHATERQYICDVCRQSYKSKYYLVKHLRAIHFPVYVAKCKECNIPFTFISEYKKHMDQKHNEVQEAHVCHLCGKELATKGTLKAHMTTHITKEEVLLNGVECDVCHVKFSTKYRMRAHKKRNHETEKGGHICDICGKVLCGPKSLRGHKVIHQEKAYKCEFCGKAFAFKAYVKEHMRVHTGEKPFDCDTCGMKFVSQSSLKRHKKREARRKLKEANKAANKSG